MKEVEKVALSDAIKANYAVAPLKIDLTATVADQIYGPKTAFAGDIWLYRATVACWVLLLALCMWMLSQNYLSPEWIVAGLSLIAFLVLSYKETKRWVDESYIEIWLAG